VEAIRRVASVSALTARICVRSHICGTGKFATGVDNRPIGPTDVGIETWTEFEIVTEEEFLWM
jgi:hypothetical protein